MNPLKVFYVDDEPDIREVTSMSLEIDPQIEVRTAGSGPETLAQLDADGWRPDVFLLDIMMPGMDGPGLLKAIRERLDVGAAPAIFITARTVGGHQEAIRAAGAIGAIAKPFDPMTLASEIRAVLAAG